MALFKTKRTGADPLQRAIEDVLIALSAQSMYLSGHMDAQTFYSYAGKFLDEDPYSGHLYLENGMMAAYITQAMRENDEKESGSKT